MRRLRRFLDNHRGVAAIEFAIVAPLLVALLIGVFEVSNAIIVYMKVIDAADTVSDLVSQQESVASSDFDNLYIAGQLIMTPSPGASLRLAIASVTFDPNTGNPSVAWQVTRGGATPMTDAAAAAVGLGAPGDSVIVARASYAYTSPLQHFLPTTITLSARVITRPRLVSSIPCTDCSS